MWVSLEGHTGVHLCRQVIKALHSFNRLSLDDQILGGKHVQCHVLVKDQLLDLSTNNQKADDWKLLKCFGVFNVRRINIFTTRDDGFIHPGGMSFKCFSMRSFTLLSCSLRPDKYWNVTQMNSIVRAPSPPSWRTSTRPVLSGKIVRESDARGKICAATHVTFSVMLTCGDVSTVFPLRLLSWATTERSKFNALYQLECALLGSRPSSVRGWASLNSTAGHWETL